MEYKYAENCNYEDFASGRVLYHTNGVPNFPVRLANEIYVQIFQADALQPIQLDIKPDIIITDVPYGNLVDWQGGTDYVSSLLESLRGICGSETIIAICMNKNQKLNSKNFKRLEKQNIGKRRFEIYKLVSPDNS